MKWVEAKGAKTDLPIILFGDIVKELMKKWKDLFLDSNGKIIERKGDRTTKLFELLTELGSQKNTRYTLMVCRDLFWKNIRIIILLIENGYLIYVGIKRKKAVIF